MRLSFSQQRSAMESTADISGVGPVPSRFSHPHDLSAMSECAVAVEARSDLNRRQFVLTSLISLGISSAAAGAAIRAIGPWLPTGDIFSQVTPEAGIETGISFGDSLQKLIAAGALDPGKLRSLSNGLPNWVERLLAAPSTEPIVFTPGKAPYLVQLLWPLGLSNKANFNRSSVLNTVSIPSFASTGGWTLGREPNGYVYFNKVDAVPMTNGQEALVLEVAKNSFRPCCDNSTFFQDCNHGSALLGLIELAVAQERAPGAIYRIALAANSYWFPNEFTKTALSFLHFEGRFWNEVEAERVLGAKYSSLSGWELNVEAPLMRANVHLPAKPGDQLGCGI